MDLCATVKVTLIKILDIPSLMNIGIFCYPGPDPYPVDS